MSPPSEPAAGSGPNPDPTPGAAARAADERGLVEGLQRSDPDSVHAFLERTHHPVYCLAARLSADPETRRDWAHDVLLGILDDVARGRFEYRGPGSFWGWFRKRAHFRLLDAYRRERLVREREAPHGGPSELPESGRADERGEGGVAAWPFGSGSAGGFGASPDEELRRVEVQAALERCLAGLANDDHRRSLELLLFRDLPYEGIAEALGAPLNTVRAWIRRGRTALRRCLVRTLDLLEGAQPSAGPDPSFPRRSGDE